MAFDLYVKSTGSYTRGGEPTAWMTPERIHLNQAAMRLIGQAYYVKLYWDASRRVIGLQVCEEEDEQTLVLNLRSGKSGPSGTLCATGFVRRFGLHKMCGRQTLAPGTGEDKGLWLLSRCGDQQTLRKPRRRPAADVEATSSVESAVGRMRRTVYNCRQCGGDWPDGRVRRCAKCGSSAREVWRVKTKI